MTTPIASRPSHARRDVLAHVPAERVHDLVLFRDRVIDLLRLLADAGDRATGALRVVERPAVVVAELDHDEVTQLHLAEHFVPEALRLVCAAAAAPARLV